MAAKKQQAHTSNTGAVLATLAGITAAAIGGYYLYGHRDAEKNRAKVRGWMLKAKGEVLDELEKVGEVTESMYTKAVDTVAAKYRDLRNIDPEELDAFIEEMKDHWQGIKSTVGSVGKKTPTKSVSRTRKTTKK